MVLQLELCSTFLEHVWMESYVFGICLDDHIGPMVLQLELFSTFLDMFGWIPISLEHVWMMILARVVLQLELCSTFLEHVWMDSNLFGKCLDEHIGPYGFAIGIVFNLLGRTCLDGFQSLWNKFG